MSKYRIVEKEGVYFIQRRFWSVLWWDWTYLYDHDIYSISTVSDTVAHFMTEGAAMVAMRRYDERKTNERIKPRVVWRG